MGSGTLGQLNQVLLHPDQQVGSDLQKWLNGNGGDGLFKAIGAPGKVLSIVREAHLRGLGGKGYPTYLKLKAVAEAQSGDSYLICNGNEDEPGTFKDQELMLKSPHQVIEGALIAAVATGINHIIFYINPHHGEVAQTMEEAVNYWGSYLEEQQLLLSPIELRIVISSGSYVSGEETAAIESIEGRFPFPRGKPPFPSQSGLYGCPTLINNIETLANLPHIIRNGAEWFRNLGIGEHSGTKLYCLSGEINLPGIYELPMGTKLVDLLQQCGGGLSSGTEVKALLCGGPSNPLLSGDDLDVALDFDSLQTHGTGLGTGAIIVLSNASNIVALVTKYIAFFAESSCGQCPPCKSGIHYALQILERINSGEAYRGDLDLLFNLCDFLPGSGRCHLPDGAMKLIKSSLNHFLDEYKAAIG